MGIIEVFLDTVVICTLTGLAILCSDAQIVYGMDEGAVLTARAFSSVLGSWSNVALALFLCLFAFATMLGWGLYGARCAQFLFGGQVWKRFAWLQGIAVMLGAALNTSTVWLLSEIINGLMSIPNLIALAALSPQLIALTKHYQSRPGRNSAVGGTYENFNQCKPLRTVSYEKVPPSGCEGTAAGQEDLPSEYRSA
jgi:AGCS family alanine or glycine:cation symporter